MVCTPQNSPGDKAQRTPLCFQTVRAKLPGLTLPKFCVFRASRAAPSAQPAPLRLPGAFIASLFVPIAIGGALHRTPRAFSIFEILFFSKAHTVAQIRASVPSSIPNQLLGLRHQHKMSEPLRCAVCVECAKDGDSVLRLPCSHEFHTTCITRWFQRNVTPSCPLCRTQYTLPDVATLESHVYRAPIAFRVPQAGSDWRAGQLDCAPLTISSSIEATERRYHIGTVVAGDGES